MKLIYVFLTFIAPWLVTWALCGFIAWNWDASTWSEGGRVSMVLIGMSITAYSMLIFPWDKK